MKLAPTLAVAAGASSGTPATSSSDKMKCYGDASTCICGDYSAWGGNVSSPVVSSCSRAAGAAWCCQTNDFPSAGSCWCTSAQPNCARSVFGDSCSCSLAKPDQGDKPTDTCTAKAGGVCCVEPSVVAPMCTCWDKLTKCPDGRTQVPSCTVGQLQCEGKAVAECKL